MILHGNEFGFAADEASNLLELMFFFSSKGMVAFVIPIEFCMGAPKLVTSFDRRVVENYCQSHTVCRIRVVACIPAPSIEFCPGSTVISRP